MVFFSLLSCVDYDTIYDIIYHDFVQPPTHTSSGWGHSCTVSTLVTSVLLKKKNPLSSFTFFYFCTTSRCFALLKASDRNGENNRTREREFVRQRFYRTLFSKALPAKWLLWRWRCKCIQMCNHDKMHVFLHGFVSILHKNHMWTVTVALMKKNLLPLFSNMHKEPLHKSKNNSARCFPACFPEPRG